MVVFVLVVVVMMVVMLMLPAVLVVMVVGVLLLAIDQHAHVSAGDAAALGLLRQEFDAWDLQLLQGLCGALRCDFQERAHQHVAGCSHVAFDI